MGSITFGGDDDETFAAILRQWVRDPFGPTPIEYGCLFTVTPEPSGWSGVPDDYFVPAGDYELVDIKLGNDEWRSWLAVLHTWSGGPEPDTTVTMHAAIREHRFRIT